MLKPCNPNLEYTMPYPVYFYLSSSPMAPALQHCPTGSGFQHSSAHIPLRRCITPHVCASSKSGIGTRSLPSSKQQKSSLRSATKDKKHLFFIKYIPNLTPFLWHQSEPHSNMLILASENILYLGKHIIYKITMKLMICY